MIRKIHNNIEIPKSKRNKSWTLKKDIPHNLNIEIYFWKSIYFWNVVSSVKWQKCVFYYTSRGGSSFDLPTSTLAQKNQITNGKFSTWAPLPTLKFFFVLHQEVQLFLHLLYQSSNSIFDFNLQILFSTSLFKFYLRIQSSNSIFDFNFRASCARLSFQVNKTCWKIQN